MGNEIGIITEQGDLGYGFDELNNKDRKVYNETVEREAEKSKDNDQK